MDTHTVLRPLFTVAVPPSRFSQFSIPYSSFSISRCLQVSDKFADFAAQRVLFN